MIKNVRREGYVVNGYYFKDFTTLSLDEKKVILDWRNTEEIRKWMYSRDVISLEEHLSYIRNLEFRDDRYYWLVYSPEGEAAGVTYITNIDRGKDVGELGYYGKPESYGDGFDFVKNCFYFYFVVLQFQYFYGAVNESNINALLLDEFFGCVFSRKKQIDGIWFLTTDNLQAELFLERYNLTIVDFLKYVKKWKLTNS